MTDAAMFYYLYKQLQENNIYHSKINDADYYLDFIEKNMNNDELENAYQDFTKIYDKTNIDWVYYYVYIIIFNDFTNNINKELYEKIIADLERCVF
jgi:hypothetical protein